MVKIPTCGRLACWLFTKRRGVESGTTNNWLQSAVVFTFATPHSLFWRCVDNVAVSCKVFSPFFDLPFFFVRHIKRDLSGVYCQTFFEEKFYNEHPWGRKIRYHKPLVDKFTENPKLEEIHSVRSITFISSVLYFSLIQFNMHCRRSGLPQHNRTKSIFLVSKFSFTLHRIHRFRVILRSVYTGSWGSLKLFSSIKGRILHCLLFPSHRQPGASSYCKRRFVFKVFSRWYLF